jgi:hypothetical protein
MNMNALRIHHYAVEVLAGLALTAWLILPLKAVGAQEDKFDVLQTKTVTYTNVTVTTKAKNYIFILHASGMTSLKVADLPTEVRQQLGYAVADAAKGSTNTAAGWASREIAKISVPQMKVLGNRLEQTWRGHPPAALALISPKLIFAILGALLLVHLFYCYCCMLICRKTGNPPGVLVWVPLLQLIPMLRAAGMSGWWFLAYFVPLLNLVPTVLWPFKIAKARGKSFWVGVLLFLPVANFVAFLYLAFSDAARAEEDEGPEPKVMSLQVA